MNPANLAKDWNRSLGPRAGRARRAARSCCCTGSRIRRTACAHMAESYRDAGFVAGACGMPGHGTVPAALTASTGRTGWPPTRLGVRQARARIGAGQAAAPRRLLERRRARAQVLARRARRTARCRGRTASCCSRRWSASRRFARLRRLAGAARRSSRHSRRRRWLDVAARVQPVQVQLVSRQRRAPVVPR